MESSDPRDHVPHAVRPAQVNHHEEDGHDHRGHSDAFTDQHDVLDVFPVEDVGGDHQHDRGGRNAHQIGEVGDVRAPRYLVAHARGDQALLQLAPVEGDSQ